jgi:hypothetical protein
MQLKDGAAGREHAFGGGHMNGLKKALGLFAACTVLGATAAQAEGFKRSGDCTSSGFATCMAVHLSVLKDGLSVGQNNQSWRDVAGEGRNRTFKFIPAGDEVNRGHDAITPGACPVPSRNPLDCAASVTVTPEPVTMTLLATGLLSMSGMGLVSRKRKHLVE